MQIEKSFYYLEYKMGSKISYFRMDDTKTGNTNYITCKNYEQNKKIELDMTMAKIRRRFLHPK